MSEERMRILDMVREGKITAEEAARLLEAMRGPAPAAGDAGGASAAGAGAGRSQQAGSGERDRRRDDPIGSIVDAVTDAFTSGDWGRFRGAWAGRWRGGPWGGDWPGGPWNSGHEHHHGHGWHGGHLRGMERKGEREAEGWTIATFSEGDRGTFQLAEGAKLRVESEAGSVEVRATDGPARLDLEGDDFHHFGTYVATRGDEVIVAAHRTDYQARMPRLVVSVPTHIGRLSVETAGGGVEASGFACQTRLKTAGGSVKVRGHGSGALEIRTAGGGVDVEGSPETLDAHTAGGSIRLKGHTNALDAKTAGGSINIDGLKLVSGSHRAKTAGGSINLRLSRDSSVAIEAATGAGHINVDLPGAQGQVTGSRIAPRYHGQFNGSGATLELRTVGWSINLGVVSEGPEAVAA